MQTITEKTREVYQGSALFVLKNTRCLCKYGFVQDRLEWRIRGPSLNF